MIAFQMDLTDEEVVKLMTLTRRKGYKSIGAYLTDVAKRYIALNEEGEMEIPLKA